MTLVRGRMFATHRRAGKSPLPTRLLLLLIASFAVPCQEASYSRLCLEGRSYMHHAWQCAAPPSVVSENLRHDKASMSKTLQDTCHAPHAQIVMHSSNPTFDAGHTVQSTRCIADRSSCSCQLLASSGLVQLLSVNTHKRKSRAHRCLGNKLIVTYRRMISMAGDRRWVLFPCI